MSKDRPALPAATNCSGAVVIDAAETGTAVIELPELPQRLAPSIALLQGGERIYAEAVEIEETAIPIPESAPRWAHDGAAFSAEDVSGTAWGVRSGAGGGCGRKGSVAGSRGTGRRLRAALLTGGLLATFALGWFVDTIRSTRAFGRGSRRCGAQAVVGSSSRAARAGRAGKRGQRSAAPATHAGNEADYHRGLDSARCLRRPCLARGSAGDLARGARRHRSGFGAGRLHRALGQLLARLHQPRPHRQRVARSQRKRAPLGALR
jgi:hypothetical protein